MCKMISAPTKKPTDLALIGSREGSEGCNLVRGIVAGIISAVGFNQEFGNGVRQLPIFNPVEAKKGS
ncbi:MAG: hypothetical protein RMK91_02950 [Pseudanabaenaceae cyanobacterium SKYGB_i_bin29]|nr:hypothetical protein [Pseudanabaenaceae cyanobacterium SKYG29]MDW8420802.1 hypothetical protein [Pseudanabaenaceae cyanobacterium SKYGB_i_bin29]